LFEILCRGLSRPLRLLALRLVELRRRLECFRLGLDVLDGWCLLDERDQRPFGVVCGKPLGKRDDRAVKAARGPRVVPLVDRLPALAGERLLERGKAGDGFRRLLRSGFSLAPAERRRPCHFLAVVTPQAGDERARDVRALPGDVAPETLVDRTTQ